MQGGGASGGCYRCGLVRGGRRRENGGLFVCFINTKGKGVGWLVMGLGWLGWGSFGLDLDI